MWIESEEGLKNKVIADQAVKIIELEDKITQYVKRQQEIYSMLICIGGPLNDNNLGFNRKQIGFLYKIHNLVNTGIEEQ